MSASPILVFPWQRPFLPDLKAFLTSIGKGRAGATLLIVPHNRPWRYLTKLYAEEGYQGLLPKVMTLADVISAWRSQTSADPLHTANVLDRVALLHECVMGLAQDDEGLAARFARMDMAHFLPWGLRPCGCPAGRSGAHRQGLCGRAGGPPLDDAGIGRLYRQRRRTCPAPLFYARR